MAKPLKLGDIGVGESSSGGNVEMRDVSVRRTAATRGKSASPLRGSKRRCDTEGNIGGSTEFMDVGVRVCVDEVSEMSSVSAKLRKYVFAEANRISKAGSEFILQCASDYEKMLVRMMMKNERLEGRIDEYEKRMKERVSVSKSYASVSGSSVSVPRVSGTDRKKSVTDVSERVKERTYAVVVKPMDENVRMSSEQVKESVMKNVSGELNVRVRAVRKTRNGGVAIEAASEKEVRMISECRKFAELGLKVEPPKKIGPKVVVFDVPNDLANECFLKELYEKNVKNADCGVSREEFMERVKVVSRNNKKDACVGNVIVEMSRSVRDIVLKEGRVYVRWCACRVKEFVNVLRCYKCFAFGHMMRECSMTERLCQKCGETGHLRDKCKKECVCRNCRMKGKDASHSVLSVECPEYVRMLMRERIRISDD